MVGRHPVGQVKDGSPISHPLYTYIPCWVRTGCFLRFSPNPRKLLWVFYKEKKTLVVSFIFIFYLAFKILNRLLRSLLEIPCWVCGPSSPPKVFLLSLWSSCQGSHLYICLSAMQTRTEWKPGTLFATVASTEALSSLLIDFSPFKWSKSSLNPAFSFF